MVQVIGQEGLGELLGGSVGQGFSQGLQMLMDAKMKSLQAQNLLKLTGDVPNQQKGRETDTVDESVTETPKGKDVASLSDSQIRVVSAMDSNMGKLLQSQKEAAVKKEEKFNERSFQRNRKYFEKLDEERMSMPKKKLALSQMANALESGDFESLRNTIADYTELDFLKTASAQQVNAAIKEYLIGDLASITGRPNQFIEKQITKALINPQYRKEANKVILEGLQGLQRLKEREIEISSELEEKYAAQGKEVPRNFQRLVQEKLKKETEEFEQNYETRVKDIFKDQKKSKGETELFEGEIIMFDTLGERRAVLKKDVKAAKQAGYKVAK